MSAPIEARATSLLAAAALCLAVAVSCTGDDAPPPGQTEAELRALLRLPEHLEVPAIPAQNSLTPEKIALGRRLFYDVRLSGNQTQSCATCHLQEHAFADARTAPVGSTGEMLVRNSPGLANVAYFSTLTWASNGLLDLERQIHVPIRGENPVELGVSDGNLDEVLARFANDPDYAAMFAAAFPDVDGGVTMNEIVFALASFCRTMISSASAYDRYIEGERSALSASARRGMTLFNGERFECFHCHGGINATASYRDINVDEGSVRFPFFNNGLYNVGGDGSYPTPDQGLYQLTFDPDDRGLFRPPSLRNVELTAPYMHDGSIATLREVVLHYAAGGRVTTDGPWAGDGRVSPLKSGLVRGFQATDDEIDDVVAFLEALTDPTFVGNPDLADPSDAQ